MAKVNAYQDLLDRLAALRDAVVNQRAGDIATNPPLADELMRHVNEMYESAVKADTQAVPPADRGLGELAGIGPDAAKEFGQSRIPQGVEPYDEQITSERLVAVGDLYYIYQHEKIGVFRVIRKLKELGLVKRAGDGAYQRQGVDVASPELALNALERAAASFLRRIDRVQQLLVVRTGAGQAQPLALAIDRAQLPEAVGTIAGDDTILIVTRDDRRAVALVKRFETWAGL